MLTRVGLTMIAFGVVVAGCTTTSNAPATAPPTTASTSSTILVTPSSRVTTTTAVTTTTKTDRIAEITAIFEDIERRRLQAIYDQDEEAFRAVHANAEYEEQSLIAMDLVEVLDPGSATVEVWDVFVDAPTCLAVRATFHLGEAINGGSAHTTEHVIELVDEGWGFSWAGEGWRCDGPHPLSL